MVFDLFFLCVCDSETIYRLIPKQLDYSLSISLHDS